MKHTETELLQIKNSISEMWILVLSQLRNAKSALVNSDSDLARVVISLEKRVNAFELKIDSDCENLLPCSARLPSTCDSFYRYSKLIKHLNVSVILQKELHALFCKQKTWGHMKPC